MSSVATEPPPPGPSPQNRRGSAVFIAMALALQFTVPLTYLMRTDTSDERFTWRSLGGAEETTCRAESSLERLDGAREELELDALIQRDWVDYLQRDRRSVIEEFLRVQCENPGVLEVELRNDCNDADGVRAYKLRCGGERAYETRRTASR